MTPELFRSPIQFVEKHEGLMITLTAVSIGLIVAGALVGPYIVARLPEDYFVSPPRSVRDLSLAKMFLLVARNLLGLLLVLLGVAMLILPGQGVLTILAGVFVMDFPAKNALLRRTTRSSSVRRSLNWIRERFHQPPLRFEGP